VSDVGEFVRAKASSGPSEAKAATLATMKADTVQLRALKALGSPAGPMQYLSGAAADQVPFGQYRCMPPHDKPDTAQIAKITLDAVSFSRQHQEPDRRGGMG
jgi:hypothetical protein